MTSAVRAQVEGKKDAYHMTHGIPRPSQIRVLTVPNVVKLARSDRFACIQRGMLDGDIV